MWNSTISDVTNWNSFRNPAKIKALRYVQCVEALSVLHMEEKMISTDTRTPESMKGYVDAAQRQRKLTDFGAS